MARTRSRYGSSIGPAGSGRSPSPDRAARAGPLLLTQVALATYSEPPPSNSQ
jgi:hypothetical protein